MLTMAQDAPERIANRPTTVLISLPFSPRQGTETIELLYHPDIEPQHRGQC